MRRLIKLPIILGLLAMLAVPALASENATFDEISKHYEAIRLLLLHDTSDGVESHAKAIA